MPSAGRTKKKLRMPLTLSADELKTRQTLEGKVGRNDMSSNVIRSQSTRILVHHMLRRKGIPLEWIDCKVRFVPSPTRDDALQVCLVIKQWDDHLMTCTFALQKELMAVIEQLEPGAPTWLGGITWQLDVAATCPRTSVPDNTFRQNTARSPLQADNAQRLVRS